MSNYNLGTASGRIVVDGSGASQGFNVAQSAAEGFLNVLESRVGAVRELGDRLTKVGATGVAGFGVAVHAASKFEQQMSFVEAVSGATTNEMEKLRQKALDLGKSTAYSATEAGQAMEELIKAGLSVDDVLNGAADATVALAAAGGVELKEAATIAANAMNQFNLEASEMPKIADLVAGAANASAIDVGDFGFSLSQAGAVANLTGLKFEDLAVAIAEMGNAGIKGSDAGTSIKTFLTNLIPTTTDQIAKFKELGLYTVNTGKAMKTLADKGIKPVSTGFDDVSNALMKYIEDQGGAKTGTEKNMKAAMSLGQELGVLNNAFFDVNGNAKNMRDIQETLQNATKDLTKEQKLATLEILFGSDAIRAAAVLADNGAEGYDKMADAMGKVKAADVAATRLNNLSGKVEEMKGAFETAKIIIGNIFIPIIQKLVTWITNVVNWFNDLPEGVQKAIAVFFAVGSVVALVTGLLIKMAFILGPLLAKWLGFAALKAVWSIFTAGWAVLSAGGGVMAALSASVARATVVWGRFVTIVKTSILWCKRFIATSRAVAAAWAFITGPIGIAIAVIVAAGIILYKTFEPFRNVIDGIVDAIKGAWTSAMNGAKRAMDLVAEGFRTGKVEGSTLAQIFLGIGAAVKWFWERCIELKNVFVANVLPALREAYRVLKEQLGESFRSIQKVVKEQLIPALQEMWQVIQNDVVPALQEIWTQIQPVVEFIGKLVVVIVGGLLLALFKIQEWMYKYVVPALVWLWTYVLKYVIVALGWLIEKLVVVATKFVEWGTVIFRVLGKVYDWFKENILPVLQDVYRFASEQLGKAWDYFIDAVNTHLLPALREAWSWFTRLRTEALEGLRKIINDHIMPALRDLQAAFNEHIRPALEELWKQIQEHVMPVLQDLWKEFQEHILPHLKELGKWILIAVAAIILLVPALILLGTILILYIAGWLINTVIPAISDFCGWISDEVTEAINECVDIIMWCKERWEEFQKGIVDASVKIGEKIQWLVDKWNWLSDATEDLVNDVVGFFQWLYDVLVGHSIIPDLVNAIIRLFLSLGTQLRQLASSAVQALIQKWEDLKARAVEKWNSMVTSIREKANAIGAGIRAAFNSLPGWVQDIFRRLKDGAVAKINELITKIRNLPSTIRSAIGNLGSILYGAGQSIIRGLINGLNSMIQTLKDKLSIITNLIPDNKGPIERDRVLLEENGKVIMQGLINGLTGEEDALIAALRRLTTAIPTMGMGPSSYLPSIVSQTASERLSSVSSGVGANVVTNIYNPVAEKASDSVARRMRTLSSAGVI